VLGADARRLDTRAGLRRVCERVAAPATDRLSSLIRSVRQTDAVPETTEVGKREHLGLEVLAVLGVSLGIAALSALLTYIRAEITVPGGISHTTATVVSGSNTS